MIFEMFTSPVLEKADLDREKEIVLSEITERRGNPQYRLYYDVSRQILTPESFSNHEVLGDSEVVGKTSVEDLKRIFKSLQNRSEFIMCISGGGIDEEYVKQKVLSLNLEKGKTLALPFDFKNELFDFKNEAIQHKDGHEECVYPYLMT